MKPARRADFMWDIIGQNPNAMVPWYLMTSLMYYQHDISLLPDEDYDRLCKKLLSEWASIEHRHKHLLDVEDLRAGTGYAIKDYPGITVSAATRLAIEDGHVKWNAKKRVLVKRA